MTTSHRRVRPKSQPPRLSVECLEPRELLATSLALDFGTSKSPVSTGYARVSMVAYTNGRGFGWASIRGLNSIDRGLPDALSRDFHYGVNGTFQVKVSNGAYDVTVHLGDAVQARDNVDIWIEGQQVAAGVNTAPGEFRALTFGAQQVSDGKLNIRFQDNGGADPYFAVDGLEVVSVPSQLVVSAGSDTTADEGATVTFQGTATGGTAPLSYQWDFGDGTTALGTLTPTHSYGDNGSYSVVLSVRDALNVSVQDTAMITVRNVPPSVNAGGPYVSTVGTAILFAGLVSDPSPVDTTAGFTYSWNFGDGTTSTSATPSHAYSAAGTYTVSLRATDKDGATAIATATATVSDLVTGTIYYVSPTGSDSNAGILSKPFRTINHGVSVLLPGDTLRIRGGTYTEALLNNVPSGTSWTAPVTVAAYPGETVTLRPASGPFVVELYGKYQYIIFDGLILDAASVSDSGFYLDNAGASATANHIRLQNSEVKNAPVQGVIVGAHNSIASNYNEFINVVSHDNGPGSSLHHGFYISSSYTLLDGVEAYGNGGMGIQIYRGGGVNGVHASYNTVRNSKLHDNGIAGLEIGVGDGNVAYSNLIWNNPSAIFVEYGASNTKLYNNTIYNSTDTNDYAIRIGYSGGASNTIVKNNVVWQTAGSESIANYGTGTVYSNNLGDKAMRNEGAGSGTFSNNLVGGGYNPLFVNAAAADFHVQAGSAAIDRGTTLTEVISDFDGISRPQGGAYDIGAYEYH
jgi:PKD repeat protein